MSDATIPGGRARRPRPPSPLAGRLVILAQTALGAAARRLSELRTELRRLNTIGIDATAVPGSRRERARRVRRALAERNADRNPCC